MFLANSRIQYDNGINFYERDILVCEYLMDGDCEIMCRVDYAMPGFGIALLDDNGKTPDLVSHVWLFSVGQNTFRINERRLGQTLEPVLVSAQISAPEKNMQITLSMVGRNIEMRRGSQLVGQYQLPKLMEQYRVGIYSNYGNKVTEFSVKSGTPRKWLTNVRNANGGRIRFFDNGFLVEKCQKDIETGQDSIPVPAGEHLLSFIKTNIDGKNDVCPYVFLSSDDRINDDKKNLLDENNRFTLEEDANVTVKFKGTSGKISEISIKDDEHDDFVPTGEKSGGAQDGSRIIIDMTGVTKVEWRGTIEQVPSQTSTEALRHAVVESKSTQISIDEPPLTKNTEYEYEFDKDRLLQITGEGDYSWDKTINMTSADNKKIVVFRNVRGTINFLQLTFDDETTFNPLLQDTYKVYVPAAIRGPIIVMNEENEVFDLSSSFREDASNGNVQYVFTNWEREVFPSGSVLTMEKPLSNSVGAVIVYGIREDAVINPELIFRMADGKDNIDAYCDKFVQILPEEMELDISSRSILFSDAVIACEYIGYVADYKKDDSYCINYKEDLDCYEVDVSANRDKIFVWYDLRSDTDASDWKMTEIKPDSSKYVVLRKKVEE